jgi:predicted 2-oxoglutarate/Fe(II)-dependent dioxygenase YbiX
MTDVQSSSIVPLMTGDPAPWFHAAALQGAPQFAFHTAGGRHILLLFFGSAGVEQAAAALRLVGDRRTLFDDERASFFGVTIDPDDAEEGRIAPAIPGIRYFLDYDGAVSRLYGAAQSGKPVAGKTEYRPFWLVLDPSLRVVARFPLNAGREALAALEVAVGEAAGPDWPPVLMVPNILDRETCSELIALYQSTGGQESGFMREVGGKTVLMTDPEHKQRRDCTIEDAALRGRLMTAVTRRLVPMVKRAFQFEVTRMERYLIGCYEAGAGHFRPHRDNTTKGTAHRRFAVTINLNAEDHDGGDLRFPEYGSRTYRAPTGGAIIFSCSLLHEATPVTRGTRYAFLPFLYDERAAELREANNAFLDPQIGAYAR